MLLKDLIEKVEILKIENDIDTEISGICYDSRKVEKGDLFVCVKGYQSDGHKYAKNAVENGAVAILCEDEIEADVPKIYVKDARKALSLVSAKFFDYPHKKMKIIGVTGTNGKTTSTYLIKGILDACGYKVGIIGTNQNMIGDRVLETERTTPESYELHKLFKEMADEKVNFVVMEVSSHSLYLDRVYGIEFEVGAISNVTQDHLDFHKTMDEYAKAKSLLFKNSKTSILNKEDSYFDMMSKSATGKIVTYGTRDDCDIRAVDVFANRSGISFGVSADGELSRISLGIPGTFTVYNALLSIGVALSLGIPMAFIKMALKNQKGVKGRLEVVDTDRDYTVMIDYAHTPDGLLNVLNSLNQIKESRVITVFGCGGDRDNKKRSLMGEISTTHSDYTVITSDNPRTESPAKIIDEIVSGVKGDNYTVIENRKEAIGYALKIARENDIVLLAGKGHETYQILKEGKIHFDEREIVKEILESGN